MNKIMKINELILDKKFYPRNAVSKILIGQYALAMRQGVKFPPVVVAKYMGKNYLIDGWHRYYATKRCNVKYIQCEISQFTSEREVYIEAVKRNITHGKTYENKEKEKIVLKLKRMGVSIDDISKVTLISNTQVTRLTEARKLINGDCNRNDKISKMSFLLDKRILSFKSDLKKLKNNNFELSKNTKLILKDISELINEMVP